MTVFDPTAEARTAAAGGAAGTPKPPHSARALPWFGALKSVTLLPPVRGQTAVPTCRAVALGDGGSLTVYSLRDGAPSPLAPPLAALPLATAAALAAAPPDSVRREGHDTALLHACTPAAAAVAAAARAAVRAPPPPPLWRDLVGPPPPPPPPTAAACTRLLITGHDDGRLRVWDAGAAGAPALLDASPWAGGAGGRARAVTALAASPAAGLAVAGHDRGSVTVHQFCAVERGVAVVEVGSDGAPPPPAPAAATRHPPGWQHVLTVAPAGPDAASISAVALAPCAGLVAVGDAGGGVTCIDVATTRVAWRACVATTRVASLCFAALDARPRAAASSSSGIQSHLPRLVLLAATDDGVSVLEAGTGARAGRGASSPSPPLTLIPLTPTSLARLPEAPLLLPWAGVPDAADAPPPGAAGTTPVDTPAASPAPSRPASGAHLPPGRPSITIPAATPRQSSRLSLDSAHLVAPSPPPSARASDPPPTAVFASPSSPDPPRRDSGEWEVGLPRRASEGRLSGRVCEAALPPPSPGPLEAWVGGVAGRADAEDGAAAEVVPPPPADESRGASPTPRATAGDEGEDGASATDDDGELLSAALAAAATQTKSERRCARVLSPRRTASARASLSPPPPPPLQLEPTTLAPAGVDAATTVAVVGGGGIALFDAAALVCGPDAPPAPPSTRLPLDASPPLLAWPVETPAGRAGVAVVTAGGEVAVFALPSLAEAGDSTPLSNLLGHHWRPPLHGSPGAGGADGALILLGGGGEVTRVGVLASTIVPPPPPPTARVAVTTPAPPLPPPAPRADVAAAADAPPKPLASLGKALLATAREAAAAAHRVAVAAAPTAGGPSNVSLTSIFLRRTSDAEEPGGGELEEGGDAAARAELFSSSAGVTDRRPSTRTAEEIRSAYGRPLPARARAAGRPAAAASSLTDALAGARAALALRGERLEGLAAATDALSADAAGFEAAAKALRERAEKKWWQL